MYAKERGRDHANLIEGEEYVGDDEGIFVKRHHFQMLDDVIVQAVRLEAM